MTKTEENKLSMYEAVSALLKQSSDVTSTIPAFAEAETGLNSLIQKINDMNTQFKNSAAGKTKSKHAAEDELLETVMEVSRALFVIARRNKDEELKAITSFTITDFRRMRDTELINNCKNISAKAAGAADELVNYGITADKLAELNSRIDAYETALGAQDSGMAEKSAARQSLSDAFKDADEILYEELDSLIEIFRNTNPDFYNQYKSARVIKDLGIRHTVTESTDTPPVSG